MSVLFLGPLPPPVHGFSVINAAMLEQLQGRTDVRVFNRAPPAATRSASGPLARARPLLHWAGLWLRFAACVVRTRPSALYAGFSGGTGQLLDLPFLALARLAGIRIYIHHHSFAYLNAHSRLTAAVLRVIRGAQHVTLCRSMQARLSERYAIPREHVWVLSNAAFLGPAAADGGLAPPSESNLQPSAEPRAETADGAGAGAAPGPRLGFLSNVTAQKGIFEFFEVLRQASARGIVYRAEIAGPVDASIAERFAAELAAQPNATHLGPVHGADKRRFYERIDLLLFPTRYVNEAEPVTILEAMQSGATVLATCRGCIGGMIPGGCGSSVSAEKFTDTALQNLQRIGASAVSAKAATRLTVQREFESLRAVQSHTLDQLLSQITSTPALGALGAATPSTHTPGAPATPANSG